MASKQSRSTAAALPQLTVNEFDAADALGVSVHFLRKDRQTRRIIPFSKVGGRVLYNLERVGATVLALEEGGHQRRQRRTAA